jgi:hypothetical protein
MATALLTRRFMSEYARRPLNVVLLVVVPLLFVFLSAGAIADFADVVGFVGDPELLAGPTAGWAAAFLAGVAGFFHVLGSRGADRRLSESGMGATRITSARLASGLILAVVAAGSALVALWLRTGISDPLRVILGTLMFSAIYLGIGVAVGAVAKSDINGSLVVIFIWMFDVFLGPAMAGGDIWITRLFPTHFATLVMLDASAGHAGPIGDLGWALIWTVGSLGLAAVLFYSGTARRGVDRVRRGAHSGWQRLVVGFRYGMREYRRNIAMWVLLVLLPVAFISLSFYVTPDDPTPVELVEDGVASVQIVSLADVHGAIMVPITIAFLAGLAGLFVVQGSLEADARLALAGFRPREILGARFGVVAVAALLTTFVALGVTAVDFDANNWAWFAAGSVLVALTFGMLGVLVGSVFGRLGGLYLMFLLPFIDTGLAQNIMFSAAPPSWGKGLPSRGAVEVLIDGAFTSTFDKTSALLLAFAWLAGLALVTAAVFKRIAEPKRA